MRWTPNFRRVAAMQFSGVRRKTPAALREDSRCKADPNPSSRSFAQERPVVCTNAPLNAPGPFMPPSCSYNRYYQSHQRMEQACDWHGTATPKAAIYSSEKHVLDDYGEEEGGGPETTEVQAEASKGSFPLVSLSAVGLLLVAAVVAFKRVHHESEEARVELELVDSAPQSYGSSGVFLSDTSIIMD